MAAALLPNVAEDIDHAESQRILTEEALRYGTQNLSTFFAQQEDPNLEGEPLSLKEIKKLCPNYFLRDTLFQVTGKAKETAPLKLSDLQHKGIARVLLRRFIQKERSLPNNNQIAIYFVQQCFVQDILRKRVNWDDKPHNAGVGLGRAAVRAQARREETDLPPRKKPVVLLPEEHEQIVELATQGATLFSQGESVESLKTRIDALEAEVLILKSQLQRYKDLHGELPPEVVGECSGQPSGTLSGNDEYELDDFLREGFTASGIP